MRLSCQFDKFNTGDTLYTYIGDFNQSFAVTDTAAITAKHIGFIWTDEGTLVASCADGTTQTTSAISTPPTATNYNDYRITFDGTTAKFYINGVLEATITTNVPSGSQTNVMVGLRSHNDSGSTTYANCRMKKRGYAIISTT